MKRYYGKDDASAAGTVLQQGGHCDGMKTVRFDVDHTGDHLFPGRIPPNVPTRDQVGDAKEPSDCGSTEASDDEFLSSCDLEGRDLLEVSGTDS